MRTEIARVGAKGFDSYAYSAGGTPGSAQTFRAHGAEFYTPYLGVCTRERVQYLSDVGIAIMPVTLGLTKTHPERFDGPAIVRDVKALATPPGCHVILDMEDVLGIPPDYLSQKLNEINVCLRGEGYRCGIYVGLPQCLTSEELWQLTSDFYWKAPGRTIDRFGALAEPTGCGFGAYQCWDTIMVGGLGVDVDFIQKDFKGRLPYWAAP